MQGLNQNGPTNMIAGNIYEVAAALRREAEAAALARQELGDPADQGLHFKLQEGVTWHDGKPFTADDVVFTLDKFLRDVHPRWRPIVKRR